MAQVVWLPSAFNEFKGIQDYLSHEFGAETTSRFTQQVIQSLDLIARFPTIGRLEQAEQGIRGILIHRYTKIFYQLSGATIYVLAFFDVRQESPPEFP